MSNAILSQFQEGTIIRLGAFRPCSGLDRGLTNLALLFQEGTINSTGAISPVSGLDWGFRYSVWFGLGAYRPCSGLDRGLTNLAQV